MNRHFRSATTHVFGTDVLADDGVVEQDFAMLEADIQGLRQCCQCGLVLPGDALSPRCQRHDAVKRAGIEIVIAEPLCNQLRHRALAGSGRTIDGNDGNGRTAQLIIPIFLFAIINLLYI